MATKLSEEVLIRETWKDAGDFQRSGIDIFPIVGVLYCEFQFTAHSTNLPYSCPAHYDMSDGVSYSLYSQHILKTYLTAVPLTTTLSDIVEWVSIPSIVYKLTVQLSCSLRHVWIVQWQFVFTVHSTTLPYSCPAHYNTVWYCRVS